MRLYHFTAREYLDSIIRDGLWQGEVPLTQTDCLNAVWLTDDSSPDGHGLTDGGPLTPEHLAVLGLPPNLPAVFPDKRAMRLTILVPRDDRRLVWWPTWAKRRLSPEWYARLNEVGGGKSRRRFLYWGTIPVKWIRLVDDLRARRPVDMDQLRGQSQLAAGSSWPVIQDEVGRVPAPTARHALLLSAPHSPMASARHEL